MCSSRLEAFSVEEPQHSKRKVNDHFSSAAVIVLSLALLHSLLRYNTTFYCCVPPCIRDYFFLYCGRLTSWFCTW